MGRRRWLQAESVHLLEHAKSGGSADRRRSRMQCGNRGGERVLVGTQRAAAIQLVQQTECDRPLSTPAARINGRVVMHRIRREALLWKAAQHPERLAPASGFRMCSDRPSCLLLRSRRASRRASCHPDSRQADGQRRRHHGSGERRLPADVKPARLHSTGHVAA
eukprot:5381044-Prymnesium_polylepis.2